MIHGDVYRDGRVHVCREMCSTCIFRPGNPMTLERGRVRDMVTSALTDQTSIICHQSYDGEHDAVCRGFYDRYETVTLALARELDAIEEVDPGA